MVTDTGLNIAPILICLPFFFFFGQECLSHSSVRSSSPSSVLTLGTKRLVHDQFLMVKPPLPYVIAQQQGQEERRGRKKKKKK